MKKHNNFIDFNDYINYVEIVFFTQKSTVILIELPCFVFCVIMAEQPRLRGCLRWWMMIGNLVRSYLDFVTSVRSFAKQMSSFDMIQGCSSFMAVGCLQDIPATALIEIKRTHITQQSFVIHHEEVA